MKKNAKLRFAIAGFTAAMLFLASGCERENHQHYTDTEHSATVTADGEFEQLGENIEPDTPVSISGAISGSDSVPTNWVAVSAGDNHTLAITADGELWAWGHNQAGQLGLGDNTNRNTPTRVGSASNWASVSTSWRHTVAITTTGEMWAWGNSSNGRLGLGDNTHRNTPTRIGSASNWAAVSAGSEHTLAITTTGELWAWGQNSGLGFGDDANRNTPTRVGSASNWAAVSAAAWRSRAVTTDGELWAWGDWAEEFGDHKWPWRYVRIPERIGDANNWAAVSTNFTRTTALTTDGELWAWNTVPFGHGTDMMETIYNNAPVRIGNGGNWATVSVGGSHTLAITTDGELWVLGEGSASHDWPRFDTPTRVGSASNWAVVSAGSNHTLAITADGELWAWGANGNGQLGLGDNIDRDTPTRVGGASNWATAMQSTAQGALPAPGDVIVSPTGIATAWIPAGTFTMGSPEDEAGRNPWGGIAEGPQRQVTISQGFWMGVYPITQEQWTRVIGSNPSHFQDNPAAGETQGRRPVEMINWYDAIVFANRLSIMEGLSPAYRLFGSTNPDDWGPVPTSNNTIWNSVEIVPDSNGWRLPTEAQWEYAARAGTTTAFSNGTQNWESTAAVNNIAWTNANAGGMTREVGRRQANPWGLHDMHGNVFEWVWDRFGAYPAQAQTDPSGVSSGSVRVVRGGSWYVSAQVARSAFRDDGSPFLRFGSLGVRLVRPTAGGDGDDSNWIAVAAGGDHTLAITAAGELWAWGRNNFGQLGLGDNINRNTPARVGDASNWAAMSAGETHTLAITTGGELWAWGRNENGQLGLGDHANRGTPVRVGDASNWAAVSAGGANTLAITTNGELWAWGYNGFGQLGLGDNDNRNTPTRVGGENNWATVSAGRLWHTLAITTDGELWAWGVNEIGMLGLGDNIDRNTPTRVGDASNWAAVCANMEGVAITTDGELWAWGANNRSRFGLENGWNAPARVGEESHWAEIAVNHFHPVILTTDGELWAGGGRVRVGDASNWVAVTAGGAHIVALTTNGELWAWGNNNFGQLGLGDNAHRSAVAKEQITSITRTQNTVRGTLR